MPIAWLAVAQSCKATPPAAPDPTLVGIAILYSLPYEPEFGSASFHAFTVDSEAQRRRCAAISVTGLSEAPSVGNFRYR